MLGELLLPDARKMYIEGWQIAEDEITLNVSATQMGAHCPDCGTFSMRENGRYTRTLVDLPCSGRIVSLLWTVRRYFCDNRDCPRVTFVEQLPEIAKRYARKTQRLTEKQRKVAYETGGEMGKRILAIINMSTSSDQILRLICHADEGEFPTPSVMGVDDWAMRKRHTYGTILIDLERQQVIDLLPDREAETLAAWLIEHPGIKVITRDRGKNYIDGITRGAPEVIQVADRFHLLQNLHDTLKRMFENHARELRQAEKRIAEALAKAKNSTQNIDETGSENISARKSTSEVGNQPTTYRELRFAKVKELQKQGMTRREVARHVHLDRRTVSKYFKLESLPKIVRGKQSISKTYYMPYLTDRWNEGCRDRKQLYEELQGMGFTGSYSSVWRATKDFPVDRNTQVIPETIQRWSPNQAAWLLMCKSETLDEKKIIAKEKLCECLQFASDAHKLAQDFSQMIREKKVDELDGWLVKAEKSVIGEFKHFAQSLRSDYSAVKAALTYSWSNGPVEGHINRLKLIKRQMYGRASFNLLRRRVIGMPAGP